MQLIFIHNILIRILKHPDLEAMSMNYNVTYNYRPHLLENSIHTEYILIKIESSKLGQLFDEVIQISSNKMASNKPTSITILITDAENTNSQFQQHFQISHAAGGIVTKGNRTLMIYRQNTWDLPKGKIEQGETCINAAIREVQEECGVKARATEKFYTTWHAFQVEKTNILKETTWYLMDCVDDTYMNPQKEESIEVVAWIDTEQLQTILNNTYASIRMLLQAHQNYIMLKKT